METITNIISHSLNLNEYFSDTNVCFIDIETTGLNRTKNMIYLIGVLYFDSKINDWVLNQYFADELDKEKYILREFIHGISTFDKIVTFNGESFDLPFIEHRLNMYSIDYIFDRKKSFDLYQLIKRNRYYLDLPDLKLKTIERSLGFFREDKYSGYDCIGFYYNYIKSKDISLQENILKHNYDDLIHMLDIIKILDVLDNIKSFNLFLANDCLKLTIDNIEIKGDIISFTGSIDSPLKNNIKYYGHNYIIVTENLNRFMVSVEYKHGYITKELQCYYIDLLDFQHLGTISPLTFGYNLPSNILLLIIEKKYCMDNIKNLLGEIFKNIFYK